MEEKKIDYKNIIVKIINKYYDDEIILGDDFSMWLITVFLDSLINHNPYLGVEDSIIVKISDDKRFKIQDNGGLTRASYLEKHNKIFVSYDYLDLIFNKKVDHIMDLINTLFHEREHAVQERLINSSNSNELSQEDKDKISILLQDNKKNKLKMGDTKKILSLFKENTVCFGGLKELSEKQLIELADSIVYVEYLKRKCEEGARESAIINSKKFINELINDPNLCEKAKNDFKNGEAKRILEEIISLEEKYEKKSNNYNEYYKALDSLTNKDLTNTEQYLNDSGVSSDKSNEKEYERTIELFKGIIYEKLSKMSYTSLYLYILESIELGLPIITNIGFDLIMKDPYIYEHQLEFIEEIMRILKDDNVGYYPLKIDYSRLLSDSKISTLVKKYLQEDKIKLVEMLVLNVDLNKNDMTRYVLLDELVDYRKRLVGKFLKRDKTIVASDIDVMNILIENLADKFENDSKSIKKKYAKLSSKKDKILFKTMSTALTKKQDKEMEDNAVKAIYGEKYFEQEKVEIDKLIKSMVKNKDNQISTI